MDMCSYARLFAAYHVLLRLTAPQASAMNLYFPGHIFLPVLHIQKNTVFITLFSVQELPFLHFTFFPSLVSFQRSKKNDQLFTVSFLWRIGGSNP